MADFSIDLGEGERSVESKTDFSTSDSFDGNWSTLVLVCRMIMEPSRVMSSYPLLHRSQDCYQCCYQIVVWVLRRCIASLHIRAGDRYGPSTLLSKSGRPRWNHDYPRRVHLWSLRQRRQSTCRLKGCGWFRVQRQSWSRDGKEYPKRGKLIIPKKKGNRLK